MAAGLKIRNPFAETRAADEKRHIDAVEGQGNWTGRAASISGRSGKTLAESWCSGLPAHFFPAISKVGTAPAGY
jgi:hypothetical protein